MALPQRYIEKDFYTEEEYLTWEEDAVYKSEYVRGEIRAMSGGTEKHGAISMSIGGALLAALRGRGCRVLSSDVKVRTADGVFRYPDVSVVCGPSQYHGWKQSILTNPLLVVEVLSDSTAATDRGEKFHECQAMLTLTDYLLVSQRAPLVEHYARGVAGHWDYQAVMGVENNLVVPLLSITLALADIYDQIEFGNSDQD